MLLCHHNNSMGDAKMSWDIYIQDIPEGLTNLDDWPEDYEMKPLGRRDDIISIIKEVIPEVDFSNPSWGVYEGDVFRIEFSIGDEELCDCIALHILGEGEPVPIINQILSRLNCRALDCSAGGIYDPEKAMQSFKDFQEYRDKVIGRENVLPQGKAAYEREPNPNLLVRIWFGFGRLMRKFFIE